PPPRGRRGARSLPAGPGVAPATLGVRVGGAESLAVAAGGGLVLHRGVGNVRLTPPVAYQEIAGTRHTVPAAYVVAGEEYGFRLRDYDPTRAVVIDPLLQATPLGGSGEEIAFALAIGPAGGAYVGGAPARAACPGPGARRTAPNRRRRRCVRRTPDRGPHRLRGDDVPRRQRRRRGQGPRDRTDDGRRLRCRADRVPELPGHERGSPERLAWRRG